MRSVEISSKSCEIAKEPNTLNLLDEFYFHKPCSYDNDFFEPLNIHDIQTYISPILFEADSIWFEHSSKLKIFNDCQIE